MHNLTQLCCPICMNISILGHILPADPAVSLCRAWFLAAAELCSNYAAAPGRGTQTASVSLGCSSPGCLWKAAIALPALPPWQAVPGVGLRLAQCPSGVAVIGVPRRGSQRGQQRVLWRSRLRPAPCGALRLPPWHGTVSLTCAGGVGSGWSAWGWHIPPSNPCCGWMKPSIPVTLPCRGGEGWWWFCKALHKQF